MLDFQRALALAMCFTAEDRPDHHHSKHSGETLFAALNFLAVQLPFTVLH